MNKIFFLFLLLILVRCGSDSSSSNSLSNAIGSIAISSPTAHTSDATASVFRNPTTLFGMLQFPAVQYLLKLAGITTPRSSYAATTDLKDLATAKSEITDILDNTSVASCLSSAFSFTPTLPNLTCYGPQINYDDHPDYATPNSNQFPSGDAGLWTATETGGEACAAAKMNGVVKNVGDIVNGSLKTLAALLCVGNVSKYTLPAAGETALSFTSILNSNVTGGNFTAASLEQLAARAGATNTYKMVLTGTVNAKVVELTLIHSPTNADNTTFKGHLHGKIGYGSTVTAFSLTYNQSATTLSAVLRTGDMTSSSDAVFDGSNDLDYSAATLVGHSVYYNLIRINSTNGLGTAYSAWQANPSDSNTRVFQAETTSASPADTGVAYFGFGPQITTATGRGTIDRMICHWSGPGADHTGIAFAQKQTMTRNGSGTFVPAANNITYALTTTCDYNGAGTFAIGVNPASPSALGAVTNNLVATSDIASNITTLTEPTY